MPPLKQELEPYKISKLVPFTLSPYNPFGNPSEEGRDDVIGSVSKDGYWAWLAKDGYLEVFTTHSSERCGSWNFSLARDRPPSTITAVVELLQETNGRSCSSTCLAVALVCDTTCSSLVCLFDLATFKIVKAIELPHKIVSLASVSPVYSSEGLHSLLKMMVGVLAVGTDEGRVFLLDLALDDHAFSDETCPDQITLFSIQSNGSSIKRNLGTDQHFALALNEEHFKRDTFLYVEAMGAPICKYSIEEAAVTALEYLPHLGMLAVGFKFGGFQFWDLSTLELIYSFGGDVDEIPVVKFAFQQPENDPRHFVYLWVIRGYTKRSADMTLSFATLFALSFHSKEWITDFGHYYKGFEGCAERLEYWLGPDPHSSYRPPRAHHSDSLSSKVVACSPIQHLSSSPSDLNSSDLSLCLFAWQVYQTPSDPSPQSFLTLFDLNQWYKAQMPAYFRQSRRKLNPFLGVFSLHPLEEQLNTNPLVDIYIVSRSLSKFAFHAPADEYFYPSSLSFRLLFFSDVGIVQATYLGIQRQVLCELVKMGPAALVEPKELFQLCVYSGLIDGHEVSHSATAALTMNQRESLLNLALEHHLSRFLMACLSYWASGEYSQSGCTLQFLSSWAWRRVASIKASIDKFCVPLFNYSDQDIDETTLKMFQNYLRQLETIAAIYHSLPTVSPITDLGVSELETRQEVVQFITVFLKAVLWLIDCNLLPESSDTQPRGDGRVPYPALALTNFYKERRQSLQQLHSSFGPTDILLIDQMVKEVGSPLTLQWERAGGSGLYPPPTLYSSLAAYLLPSIPLAIKHQIFYYFILDVVDHLSSSQQTEASSPLATTVKKLASFPSLFGIPGPKAKVIQGFWFLDHQEFERAIETLVDASVTSADIAPHQVAAVKALLYQGEHQKALHLTSIHQLPCTSPDHIRLHLSLLLINGKITEAFHFQRNYRDLQNSNDLLKHFFSACLEMHKMESLLKLPLDEWEEKELVRFLKKQSENSGEELLILYFLQKSRPLEAARLISKISNNDEQSDLRRSIVSCYLHALPDTQKTLALHRYSSALKHKDFWKQKGNELSASITPLSTSVKNLNLPVSSRSSLMEHIITKVSEVQGHSLLAQRHLSPSSKGSLEPDEPPFIGSPFPPSKKKSWSLDVSFPTPISKRASQESPMTPGSPLKKSRHLETSIPDKRKSQVNKELLSILHMPPISKMSPGSLHYSSPLPKTFVPSSILKGSKSSLSSPKPSSLKFSGQTEISTEKEEEMKGEACSSKEPGHPTPPKVLQFQKETPPDHKILSRRGPATPKRVQIVSPSASPPRESEKSAAYPLGHESKELHLDEEMNKEPEPVPLPDLAVITGRQPIHPLSKPSPPAPSYQRRPSPEVTKKQGFIIKLSTSPKKQSPPPKTLPEEVLGRSEKFVASEPPSIAQEAPPLQTPQDQAILERTEELSPPSQVIFATENQERLEQSKESSPPTKVSEVCEEKGDMEIDIPKEESSEPFTPPQLITAPPFHTPRTRQPKPFKLTTPCSPAISIPPSSSTFTSTKSAFSSFKKVSETIIFSGDKEVHRTEVEEESKLVLRLEEDSNDSLEAESLHDEEKLESHINLQVGDIVLEDGSKTSAGVEGDKPDSEEKVEEKHSPSLDESKQDKLSSPALSSTPKSIPQAPAEYKVLRYNLRPQVGVKTRSQLASEKKLEQDEDQSKGKGPTPPSPPRQFKWMKAKNTLHLSTPPTSVKGQVSSAPEENERVLTLLEGKKSNPPLSEENKDLTGKEGKESLMDTSSEEKRSDSSASSHRSLESPIVSTETTPSTSPSKDKSELKGRTLSEEASSSPFYIVLDTKSALINIGKPDLQEAETPKKPKEEERSQADTQISPAEIAKTRRTRSKLVLKTPEKEKEPQDKKTLKPSDTEMTKEEAEPLEEEALFKQTTKSRKPKSKLVLKTPEKAKEKENLEVKEKITDQPASGDSETAIPTSPSRTRRSQRLTPSREIKALSEKGEASATQDLPSSPMTRRRSTRITPTREIRNVSPIRGETSDSSTTSSPPRARRRSKRLTTPLRELSSQAIPPPIKEESGAESDSSTVPSSPSLLPRRSLRHPTHTREAKPSPLKLVLEEPMEEEEEEPQSLPPSPGRRTGRSTKLSEKEGSDSDQSWMTSSSRKAPRARLHLRTPKKGIKTEALPPVTEAAEDEEKEVAERVQSSIEEKSEKVETRSSRHHFTKLKTPSSKEAAKEIKEKQPTFESEIASLPNTTEGEAPKTSQEFTFAHPHITSSPGDVPKAAGTTVLPQFVFSPPATRRRHRQRTESTEIEEAAPTAPAAKRASKSSTRRISPPKQSVLNVSMLEDSHATETKPSPPKHGMTLRHGKTQPKH